MVVDIASEQLSHGTINITTNNISSGGDSLLQQCELLSYTDRMKWMVKAGRESISNPVVAQDLQRLSTGSVYERLLALQAAWGSGDPHVAMHALRTYTSKSLKYRAVKLIMIRRDDQMAQEALLLAPEILRHSACHWLRKKKKFNVVDGYLDSLDVRGHLLKKLLPNASSDFVRRTLPAIVEEVDNWPSIIRLHPAVAYDVVRGMFTSNSAGVMTGRQRQIISHLAKASPELADKLICLVLQWKKLPMGTLGFIIGWRPREVAQKYHDDNDIEKHLSFSRYIRKLSNEQVVKLYKTSPDTLVDWDLKKLSLGNLRILWEAVGSTWRGEDGSDSPYILAALLVDIRIQEAYRNLNLDIYKIYPDQIIDYIGLLPWEEASVKMKPFIHSHEVSTRKSAIENLIKSTVNHPKRAQIVIDLILHHSSERETVRVAMFGSLSGIPPKIWGQEHLNGLSKTLRSALCASDLSRMFIAFLRGYITELIPYHTKWAGEQAALLVSERSGPPTPLYMESCPEILPAFLPRMRRLYEQKDWSALLELFDYLQPNIESSEELLDMLRNFIVNTTDKAQATCAFKILQRRLTKAIRVLYPP